MLIAEAGFVVKTKKKETGEKVFINICKAEKIKVATSKPMVQNGVKGSTWDVPYSFKRSGHLQHAHNLIPGPSHSVNDTLATARNLKIRLVWRL
eukprot:4984453-Pyramimonas_sp.AAC.1